MRKKLLILISVLLISLLFVGCKEKTGDCDLYVYTCEEGGIVTEMDGCTEQTVTIGNCDQCAVENVWFPVNDGLEPKQPFSIVKEQVCSNECQNWLYECKENEINVYQCGDYEGDLISCCCNEADHDTYSSEKDLTFLRNRFCQNIMPYQYYCSGNNINVKECGQDKGKVTDCFNGQCQTPLSDRTVSDTQKSKYQLMDDFCVGNRCTETDSISENNFNGKDPYLKGITTDKWGEASEADFCWNNTHVEEHWCIEGGLVASDRIECANGKCNDGVCTQTDFKYGCKDEDGKNIYTQGKLSVKDNILLNISFQYVDECIGGKIIEYYCNDPSTGYKSANGDIISELFGSSEYTCKEKYTCAGGVCLEQKDCKEDADCPKPPCVGISVNCALGKCEYSGNCLECTKPEDCNDNNEETIDECINNKCRNKEKEPEIPLWVFIAISIGLILTGIILYFAIPKKRRKRK